VNKIKKLSLEILSNHKIHFSTNFTDNKKALDKITIIRSKSLKNKLAGFITKIIKKEIRNDKFRINTTEPTSTEPTSTEPTHI